MLAQRTFVRKLSSNSEHFNKARFLQRVVPNRRVLPNRDSSRGLSEAHWGYGVILGPGISDEVLDALCSTAIL